VAGRAAVALSYGFRMATRPSQEERGRRFATLHEEGCFLIPNPWDGGSARVLEGLGFEALATTSSGFAFTLGRDDGEVTLDEVVEHVARLVAASDLPVSVDLENGFGAGPEHAARAIEAVAAVGAVGGSIEDWGDGVIYEIGAAAGRIEAAAAVVRELPFPFLLTARAENQIRGNPDLDDTIARLRAYEEAGADVLYAPGLATPAEIEAVVGAVGKPVNVLARPDLSVAEIAAAGARRISVGGSLAWATFEAMGEVATRMRDDGDLSGLRGGAQVSEWLGS
jgi:2-methylisocitrate lyase-like PEP mutase family enzyme